jgi:hypothetical protein
MHINIHVQSYSLMLFMISFRATASYSFMKGYNARHLRNSSAVHRTGLNFHPTILITYSKATKVYITWKTGNFFDKCHASGEQRCLSFENKLSKWLFVSSLQACSMWRHYHALCGAVCLHNLQSKEGGKQHKIQDSPGLRGKICLSVSLTV